MRHLLAVVSLVALVLVSMGLGETATSRPASQPTTAARQEWAAGKYAVVVKSATTMSRDEEGPATSITELRYELRVEKANARGQKVQIVFTHSSCQGKGGAMEKVQWDTDKPAGNDKGSLQSQFKAMIGMAMETTIGTDGKVGEVTGLDEIVKKMEPADNPSAIRLSETMCRSSATEAITALILQCPAEPIFKGCAWTHNDQMSMGMLGAVKMIHNYKVNSVVDTPDGKVAEIALTATNAGSKPVATDDDSVTWGEVVPIEEVDIKTERKIKLRLDTGMIASEEMRTRTFVKGNSLMDGRNLPFSVLTETDTKVVVTYLKETTATSTRPE